MKIHLKYIIIILLLLNTSIHTIAQQDIISEIKNQKESLKNKPNDIQALKELCFLYLHKADYQNTIKYGKRLLQIGKENNDEKNSILYANIALGQGYLMQGDSIAYNYLMQAKLIGEKVKNDTALCSIFNGMGLYACNINKDYYSSLYYFFKGLKKAQLCHHKELQAILLGNISSIYYLRHDTTGLAYSLKAYKIGHEVKSPYLIYIGALNTASIYLIQQNIDKVLQYTKEVEFIMNQNDFHDKGNIYFLYGMIASAKGNQKQAISLFKKGLSLKEKNQTSINVCLLYGYANALTKENKYSEAIKLLNQALTVSKEQNCPVFRNEIINTLSSCYESMGKYSEALIWHRKLQQETDSIFNIEKEKILSELHIKYDTERQKNEIKQNKLTLLQKEKKEQILISILILILAIVVILYYFYRKQSQLYTSIVRQNQDAIRREQQLQNTINTLRQHNDSMTAESIEKVNISTSSLTDEKKNALFQQLETLMQEQKLYKEHFLTKERVVELLDTNRTYLAQIIKEQTQLNFTQYINNYRINEAIRLLSDPQNDAPLKAIASDVGFNSMTTFYKVFQNTTGIPPKQYREKVLSLHKNNI